MNQKEILTLSVGIFFTIIAWMVIEVYQAETQRQIVSVSRPITPVNYKIDDAIFKILQEKIP